MGGAARPPVPGGKDLPGDDKGVPEPREGDPEERRPAPLRPAF